MTHCEWQKGVNPPPLSEEGHVSTATSVSGGVFDMVREKEEKVRLDWQRAAVASGRTSMHSTKKFWWAAVIANLKTNPLSSLS